MSFQITRYKKELPPVEKIVYYLLCILSLGTIWLMKIILKKAFAESAQDSKQW